ncbi:MAG: hypothetical protein D6784_17995 [Chloroflexi bacterium]|nr:MAG: hypothetical protein D6784_17995 [Chloroflexota bacterium]
MAKIDAASRPGAKPPGPAPAPVPAPAPTPAPTTAPAPVPSPAERNGDAASSSACWSIWLISRVTLDASDRACTSR